MPDIRLQALPQANIPDQALAVGGESIYDLLDALLMPGTESSL
jgi:hypothetical protein